MTFIMDRNIILLVTDRLKPYGMIIIYSFSIIVGFLNMADVISEISDNTA